MATSYDIHNWKEKLLVMGMLSELDHPNILKCYGQYEKDGKLCDNSYIVQEYYRI